MIKFFRQRKQEKQLTEQIDGRFPIRLDLPLRVVFLRKLTVADFLCDGLLLNFFQDKTGVAGRFAKLEQMLAERDPKTKKVDPEQTKFIETVLSTGVKDFKSDEWLEIEKIIVFNYIIISSCEKFSDVVHPDKTMALNCHYLAKHYGGDPWTYLTQSLDQFLFNLYCLNSGLKDESTNLKKAMKRQKIK